MVKSKSYALLAFDIFFGFSDELMDLIPVDFFAQL